MDNKIKKSIVKKKVPLSNEDYKCLDCSLIYKVYSNNLLYPIECEKCRTLVWFETRDHPDLLILLSDKKLKQKYKEDKPKRREIIDSAFEKNLPPCPECSSRLKLYDRGLEPSPLHCPKCGSTHREKVDKDKELTGGMTDMYWLVHEFFDKFWAKEHGIEL